MELEITDPNFELEWPKDVFRMETLSLLGRPGDPTDAFEFLLEEAFVDTTPATDFRTAVPRTSGFGTANLALHR